MFFTLEYMATVGILPVCETPELLRGLENVTRAYTIIG